MINRPIVLLLSAIIIAFGAVSECVADQKYLRVKKDEKGVVTSFETEVVHLVPDAKHADPANAGLSVDLIGAVHVADASYYDGLNELFKQYDALLYELIAPPGAKLEDRDPNNPVSILQLTLKHFLKLEFQLERVNYKAPNFVHADLSPDEFLSSMQDKGESFSSMFLKLMLGGYVKGERDPQAQQTQSLKLLLAALSPQRSLIMKRVVSEELVDMDFLVSMFVGDESSTIISVRNNKALSVLKEQIGKGKRRLGIFYGAGHLPEMERKLSKDFGLKRESERWLKAWDLSK